MIFKLKLFIARIKIKSVWKDHSAIDNLAIPLAYYRSFFHLLFKERKKLKEYYGIK